MKTTLAILMIAFFSLVAAAQSKAPDTSFAAGIKKFKVEKYSMGEDASSGYDYLIYKRGADVVKIRTIWTSSANPDWWVEDAYFEAGKPAMLVQLKLTKKQYKSVKRGSQLALTVKDKSYFKDDKMVKWLENGKEVSRNDSRWAKMEEETILSAVEALGFYPDLKEL